MYAYIFIVESKTKIASHIWMWVFFFGGGGKEEGKEDINLCSLYSLPQLDRFDDINILSYFFR